MNYRAYKTVADQVTVQSVPLCRYLVFLMTFIAFQVPIIDGRVTLALRPGLAQLQTLELFEEDSTILSITDISGDGVPDILMRDNSSNVITLRIGQVGDLPSFSKTCNLGVIEGDLIPFNVDNDPEAELVLKRSEGRITWHDLNLSSGNTEERFYDISSQGQSIQILRIFPEQSSGLFKMELLVDGRFAMIGPTNNLTGNSPLWFPQDNLPLEFSNLAILGTANFNNDGRVDFYSDYLDPGFRLLISCDQCSGGYREEIIPPVRVPAFPRSPTDLNGDGYEEFVYAAVLDFISGTRRYVINMSDEGKFSVRNRIVLAGSGQSEGLLGPGGESLKLNGTDFLSVYATRNTIYLFEGTPDSLGFTSHLYSFESHPVPVGMIYSDLDNDGDSDILFGFNGSSKFTAWLENYMVHDTDLEFDFEGTPDGWSSSTIPKIPGGIARFSAGAIRIVPGASTEFGFRSWDSPQIGVRNPGLAGQSNLLLFSWERNYQGLFQAPSPIVRTRVSSLDFHLSQVMVTSPDVPPLPFEEAESFLYTQIVEFPEEVASARISMDRLADDTLPLPEAEARLNGVRMDLVGSDFMKTETEILSLDFRGGKSNGWKTVTNVGSLGAPDFRLKEQGLGIRTEGEPGSLFGYWQSPEESSLFAIEADKIYRIRFRLFSDASLQDLDVAPALRCRVNELSFQVASYVNVEAEGSLALYPRDEVPVTIDLWFAPPAYTIGNPAVAAFDFLNVAVEDKVFEPSVYLQTLEVFSYASPSP